MKPHVYLGNLYAAEGNAFAVLGAVQAALKGVDYSREEVSKVMAEAMSGDYRHLLETVTEHVQATVIRMDPTEGIPVTVPLAVWITEEL